MTLMGLKSLIAFNKRVKSGRTPEFDPLLIWMEGTLLKVLRISDNYKKMNNDSDDVSPVMKQFKNYLI
ncbi:hypothetical protein BpHYR1_004228 [Brachionus plicatilis]|uniref:Uncharacterized protein n=1 Tax=Brachionus plicatilis TaxID=10195 RepID=A0A3M7QBA2_BRAPC|nr:hypothetical protein BpHYR1_004228 [Brachionus plicatilis]